MDRWADYRAGRLTPPCVVQHDVVSRVHLVWVWTGAEIVGPLARASFDAAAVLRDATSIRERATPVQMVDERDAEIVALRAERAVLVARVAQLERVR
jgi:hypothetical protein